MGAWQDALVLVISTIGFLSFLKPILQFVKWVYCMFLRTPKNLTTYSSWALVTGCTDGIGKALAFELASKGLNLVLVSRNPQKLKSTSDEIWGKFGEKTQIKIIALDFEKVSGEEIEGQIRREIEGLDVGILINSAGLSGQRLRFFHENSGEDIDSILKVNIGSVCWVTKAVLPGMLRRKKGAIVSLGSGSTLVLPSYPCNALYAGTKDYVAVFSQNLSIEYKEQGIDIQCQAPLLVATRMISNIIDWNSFWVCSSEEYGKASLRWIGYESLCIPNMTHAAQVYLVGLLSEWVCRQCAFHIILRLRNKLLLQEESSRTT